MLRENCLDITEQFRIVLDEECIEKKILKVTLLKKSKDSRTMYNYYKYLMTCNI